jgi:cytochrome c-type biogenesis protein CcmH/NrfG
LRGWQARHNLAVVYHRQGRLDDAEAQWRDAARENPDAAQLWLGLGEVFLAGSRWDDLERAVGMLERYAPGSADVSHLDAPLLRARAHLARREFAPARALLAEVITRHPGETRPRLLMGRLLIREGADLDAAEQALRDALAIEPDHAEAGQLLTALLDYLDGDDDLDAAG